MCPAPDPPCNSKNLKVRAKLPLLLLLLLPIVPRRDNVRSNKLRPARVMRQLELLPSHQVISSFGSQQSRQGQTWRPPPNLCRDGNLHFNWTTDHSPRLQAFRCGRRVKGVALPRVWCTASYCPRMCMPSRTRQMSHWVDDCNGTLLR